MHVRHGLFGLVALGLALGQASAQSFEQTSFLFRRHNNKCDSCQTPASGPVTVVPTDPAKKDQAPQVVDAQAFAQAPAAGGELGYSFNPAMFGDLGAGAVGLRPSSSSSSSSHSAGVAPLASGSATQVAIISRGAFKISDNESPRPTDRVFMTYNYFQGIPAGNGQSYDLHRELIGFEKTFFDGMASFGMRLPFLQTNGGVTGIDNHLIGDMSLIGKAALYDDRETGNLLFAGLVMTIPTADHDIVLADGSNLNDVLFQPFVGWILNMDRCYAQGFHSFIIPTDSRDITSFNNDVAVGYWIYQASNGGWIRGVVPTIEGHLYTPLNHVNSTDLVVARDVFTLTGGVNVVLPGNSTIGVAIAAPLTGPRPNNLEMLAGFNFRF